VPDVVLHYSAVALHEVPNQLLEEFKLNMFAGMASLSQPAITQFLSATKAICPSRHEQGASAWLGEISELLTVHACACTACICCCKHCTLVCQLSAVAQSGFAHHVGMCISADLCYLLQVVKQGACASVWRCAHICGVPVGIIIASGPLALWPLS
jgi:hypothetical protein